MKRACSSILVFAMGLELFSQPLVAQHAEAKLENLLVHIAPEAQVIVAIPSLKRLNDDIADLLGGMDRADLAATGRPIDLAKSFLGLGGGIDDRGGAALMLMPGEDAVPTPLAIVPVIDPTTFIQTNFKLDEATGAYISSNGTPMYIRQIGDNTMLLAESKELLESYDPRGGSAEALWKRYGENARALFGRGEVLMLMDQSGARFALAQFGALGAMMQAGFPGEPEAMERIAAQREAIVKQMAGLAYILDVDPLGVMVHGLVTFEPESKLGSALKAPSTEVAPWADLLPRKPFYIAAGIDLKSAGAIEALESLAPMFQIDLEPLRDVLASAEQIGFITAPSPAGVTGGILNDAALVMRSSNPADLQAKVRDVMERIEAAANEKLAATLPEGSDAKFELVWTENKSVGDEGLTATAYEVRAPAGGDMMIAMARSIIFGSNQRGFITTTDDTVVITFSQRPAVFKAALAAARGEGETLANDDVLAAVRDWVGPPAPAELFINVGQINKFVVAAARSFAMGSEIDLPELDPSGPPIAQQFGVRERSMTSALAIPAPVLAEILREVERNFRPAAGDADAP